MKTLKEISEGFFNNVGIMCQPLKKFLDDNKENTVKLKNKEYIVKNLLIFDKDEIINKVFAIEDGSNMKFNPQGKYYGEIKDIFFANNGIVIRFISHMAIDHFTNYTIYSVAGRGDIEEKNKNLINFLKAL